MAYYSEADFEAIGAAMGRPLASVQAMAERFEAAAFWYHLDSGKIHPESSGEIQPGAPGKIERRPIRIWALSPYARREKTDRIARSAKALSKILRAGRAKKPRLDAGIRRLMKALAIDEISAAVNGPGDSDIFELLTYPDGSSDEHVLGVVRRAFLASDPAHQLAAVAETERLAREAAATVTRLGEMTVPKGNHGDRPINDWIDAMAHLYRALTGSEPRTSVGGPFAPNNGKATGPFIRFLAASAQPLGISSGEGKPFSEDAWRSRFRTVQITANDFEVDLAI
jgi:hypothetical protein